MNKRLLATLAAALLASGFATASPPENRAFERFKGLEGDWVATYRLTGAGSAVVEEIFSGSPPAMTTVYYLDGSDPVLTHYCMSGDQPHMRAQATSAPKVVFAFDGGTNINPKRDRFMHNATFDFLTHDELTSTWVEYADGKQAMTVTMPLVRKSS